MFTARIITNYSLLCNYSDFRYFLVKKKGGEGDQKKGRKGEERKEKKEETSESYCNSMNCTIQSGPKTENINAK